MLAPETLTRLTHSRDKPAYTLTVSMGVSGFARDVLSLVPEGRKFGFDDLMLAALTRRIPVHTFPFAGYWMDVGRPDDYEQAHHDIEQVRRLLE